MQVYVVAKTVYAPDGWLVDDYGNDVNCLTEVVGVYADEADARREQEELLNSSDYEILPSDGSIDPDVIYIDVVVETFQVVGRW